MHIDNMGGCQNDTATKRHGASLWHSDKMTQCVTLARRVTLTQRQNDTVRHLAQRQNDTVFYLLVIIFI